MFDYIFRAKLLAAIGLTGLLFFTCLPLRAEAVGHEAMAKVADNVTWHRLIKVYTTQLGRLATDVVNPEFFLAGGLPPTPLAELSATVEAFLQPPDANVVHAQCRYPARLQWLKEQLPSLKQQLATVSCPVLDKWMNETGKQKIYLVHVSGYFANPASAFGHLLLRIGDGENLRGLTDIGINFGARIPPSDGSVKYVLKGLFGGYTASFTSKKHYLQDRVYSGTESRDMWAYELALSDDQSALMRRHLWELSDQPFKYFFLNKNCAYRVAELLELVLEDDFIHKTDISYAPIKLFNRLRDTETNLAKSVVADVQFIPSHKRQNFHAFKNLPVSDARDANAVLSRGEVTESAFSTASLDFLLDHLDYKLQSQPQEASFKTLKRQVLTERLKKIEISQSKLIPQALTPPGDGPRPSTLRINYSENGNHRLAISPFEFGLTDLNRGSLVDSSFTVLSLELERQQSDLKFSRLTLLDISSYSANDIKIHGESSFAWRGGAAIVDRPGCESNCIDALFNGGFGLSKPIGNGVAFATLDATATASFREQTTGTSFGALFNVHNSVRAFWQSQYNFYSKSQQSDGWNHAIELRYSFLRDHAVDLSWTKRDNSSLAIGYRYKW